MVSIASAAARPAAPAMSKQPKAAKKIIKTQKPTLVRKRNEADMDGDTPSSPSKKAKVTFSPAVEINIISDSEKSPELIREEVRWAVTRHARGDDVEYDKLKNIFSRDFIEADIPSPTTIKNTLAALVGVASDLDRSCSALVQMMLNSDWIRRTDDYVTLFRRFLGHLASSKPTWLAPTLRMLVENFLTCPKFTLALHDLPPVTYPRIQARTHAAIRYLLDLVPSGTNALASILSNMFPEAEESRRLHVRFVHNILKIIDYAPALQSEILALITERLLKIDVQIQGDLEDLADEAEEEVVHGMSSQSRSNHDDLSDDQDSDDDMDGDDDSDPQARQAKEIKGNIEKLDILLDMLFEYYSSLFSNPNSTRFAFDALLSHFGTQIIPTYRSRHMQFLLFHFIQTTPELIDIFVGSTITMAFDTNRPTLIRQSAAAYLASFVSRGIHVPSNIVRDVFDYIGSQLTNIRLDEEPTCRGPDPRRYNTYYALTQALLYIFCFRWRDLVATQDDDLPPSPSAIMDDYDSSRPPTFIPGVKEVLSQNVFSPLNPLKVCAIPIVEQFARIAHHLSVVYVYPLLETNKRLKLIYTASMGDSRSTAVASKGDDAQRLDAYFPFDPYKLPRSKRWIENDYREWQGVPGLDDGEDSGSESDGEGEDGDGASDGTETDEEE